MSIGDFKDNTITIVTSRIHNIALLLRLGISICIETTPLIHQDDIYIEETLVEADMAAYKLLKYFFETYGWKSKYIETLYFPFNNLDYEMDCEQIYCIIADANDISDESEPCLSIACNVLGDALLEVQDYLTDGPCNIYTYCNPEFEKVVKKTGDQQLIEYFNKLCDLLEPFSYQCNEWEKSHSLQLVNIPFIGLDESVLAVYLDLSVIYDILTAIDKRMKILSIGGVMDNA